MFCFWFEWVWVTKSKFFDVQRPKSPNDEERDTSNGDGNTGVDYDDCVNTFEDGVAGVATQIEENVTSEGNISESQNGVGSSGNIFSWFKEIHKTEGYAC